MKRYEAIDYSGVPPVDCSCGTTRRAFADLADAPASAHLLELADEPVCHFHKRTTEIYIILEGHGELELDGDLVPVKPLSAVMIKPGCRHRAVGKMKLLNISVPRYDPDDFFHDEGAGRDGEAPVH
ncbi:MAG: cupin domain-containing protein [Akkermansiaceae bacterium]|nr:cupin domain-containing protein [Akkermansiaceae bacterium]